MSSLLFLLSLLLSKWRHCVLAVVLAERQVKKPNFVVLLVDDLGIGDIGCFGNDTIKTRNIDYLAKLGAKLDHNLSPEVTCSPSRAATLTGRHAIRSGVVYEQGEEPVFLHVGISGGLPPNETTIGKILQTAGYKTGFIGKWHLGMNCYDNKDGCHLPPNMGFDEFYGVPLSNMLGACDYYLRDGSRSGQSLTQYLQTFVLPVMMIILSMIFTGFLSRKTGLVLSFIMMIWFYLIVPPVSWLIDRQLKCILMRGNEVVEQSYTLENMTVRLTNEANDFIRRHKDEPFFLFMSYLKVHTSLFTTANFTNHSVHGLYGDNVEEMDWSVGEILSQLKKENLFDDTFIYFTSDHGPWLEEHNRNGDYHGGWKGLYRGGKGQNWEGGIRVPTVVTWNGHIPHGIVIKEPTNTMDIFQTMANLAGANISKDSLIDSKDIWPLLTEKQNISPHKFMFHYCSSLIQAVRYRPREGNITWKVHYNTVKWSKGREDCFPDTLCSCFDNIEHDPPLLFDITHDPYEKQPLNVEEYRDIITKIKKATEEHKRSILQVPRQLSAQHTQWNAKLQPCCNFPFCNCKENEIKN